MAKRSMHRASTSFRQKAPIVTPYFYNKVKGDVENHLLDLNSRLCISTPSLLIGKREEERLAEKLGIFA